MAKCQVCGKSTSIGRNSKHRRGVSSRQFANRAAKKSRTFKANIQKTTFMVGELKISMKVCAKCLKAMKKKQRAKVEKVELRKSSQAKTEKKAPKKTIKAKKAPKKPVDKKKKIAKK